jgi:hypothetical protein
MDALAEMISEGVTSSQDTLNSLMLSFMQSSLLASRGVSLSSQSGDSGDSLSGAQSVYVGSGVYFESTVVQNDASHVDEVVLSRESSSMTSFLSRYGPSEALSNLGSAATTMLFIGGVAFAVFRMWRNHRDEDIPV